MTRLTPVAVFLVLGAWLAGLFFNGDNLTFLALTLVLLTTWLAITLQAVRRIGLRRADPWLPATMLFFWLWLWFDSLFSTIPYLSWLNLWWVGILPLTFLVAATFPDRERFYSRLFPLLHLAVLILALVALAQHFILGRDPAGPFHTRNSLAGLINLLVPCLWGLTLLTDGRTRYRHAAVLFVLLLTVFVIQSRGAWLGLGLALCVFATFDASAHRWPRWRLPLGSLLLALVTAWLLSLWSPVQNSDLVSRVVSLTDTASAGHSRFVIWAPAWHLFHEHPFSGIGLGTYFMVIPPWLDPADRSAHFYVHNDYLQLALETGLPGLLLLILGMLAVLRLFIQGLHHTRRGDPERIALLGPFTGLLTLAIHSAFTFHLYILPITLTAGLLMGRLHAVHARLTPRYRGQRPVQPLAHLRAPLVHAAGTVLVIAAGFHFGRLALGEHLLREGHDLAASARLEAAHSRFRSAAFLLSGFDAPWFSDADLLSRSAATLEGRPDLANELLDEAEAAVQEALRRNAYRPQAYFILGRIREARGDTDGALQAWRQALIRDPRYLPARNRIARHLLAAHRARDALATLRPMLTRHHSLTAPGLREYFQLAIEAARASGETALATHLQARFEMLKRQLVDRDVPS